MSKKKRVKILENEDNLTLPRVHQIIKDRYEVDYSSRHVKRIILSLDFNYRNPNQIHSQKPEDGEILLKKNLNYVET
jgi:putative transposase